MRGAKGMRKTVTFLTVVIMLFLLCACGSNGANADTAIDEREANGYFRILHTQTKDQWGEIHEGSEYLVAIADAYNKDGNYKGVVYLLYNHERWGIDPQNFYFYVPVPGKTNAYEIIHRVDYKIGKETGYFLCDEGADGYVSEEEQPILYNSLKSRLEAGEDIVFNAKFGDYIFTIHGEGFSDIVVYAENRER